MQLSNDARKLAISLALKGEQVKSICEQLFIEPDEFYAYRIKYSEFGLEFARALNEGHHVLAEGILDMHERVPDVMKARLASENLRWYLSKKQPAVYGDRLELTGQVQLSIGAALDEARRRVLPVCDMNAAPPQQLSENSAVLPLRAAGFEPVSTPPQPENAVAAPRHSAVKTAANGPASDARNATPQKPVKRKSPRKRRRSLIEADTVSVDDNPFA